MTAQAASRLNRDRMIAIGVGVASGIGVAALVAGREYWRVARILQSAPVADARRAIAQDRLILTLVIAATAIAATVVCVALAVAQPHLQVAIAGCLAPAMAFAAAIPVYLVVYWGVPAGWHINVAEENRLAQFLGVGAAIASYSAVRVAQRILAGRASASP
jgi:hypothetical protein